MNHQPGPMQLFRAFARVSAVSAGGSTTSWIRQVLVQEKRWLTDDQFAESLSLCQVLPGPNAMNQAVYMGYSCAGWRGAAASLLGLTLLPFMLVMGLGLAYFGSGSSEVRMVLGGLGAAAAGISYGTGISMAIKKLRDPFFMTLTALVFVTLTFARWHILTVVGLCLVLSFAMPLSKKT